MKSVEYHSLIHVTDSKKLWDPNYNLLEHAAARRYPRSQQEKLRGAGLSHLNCLSRHAEAQVSPCAVASVVEVLLHLVDPNTTAVLSRVLRDQHSLEEPAQRRQPRCSSTANLLPAWLYRIEPNFLENASEILKCGPSALIHVYAKQSQRR